MDEEGETVREGVAQNGTGRQTGETGGAGGPGKTSKNYTGRQSGRQVPDCLPAVSAVFT
jgi:ribosomal protein L15